MRGRSLIQIIGLRLLLALVMCVASAVLAYLWQAGDLGETSRVIVVLLFYLFVCTWPCLLVSAAFRTLQYLQQWR